MSHLQQNALLLVSLLFAACGAIREVEQQFVSAELSTPGSMGTKFLVGFMQNVLPRTGGNAVPDAYLLVTTNETGVVEFDVTTMFGGVQSSSTYTVDSTAPTRVNFPADDVYVTGIQERDKAIWVQTSNNKKIAIQVINDEFRSTDGFVALPCDSMTVPSDFRTYEYLILSTNQDTTDQPGSTPRSSQFLVITCDDDTEVEVAPSTSISGSGVFQHPLFGPGTSQASSNWRVNTDNNLIPAHQTLLISITNQDLTGTVVKGNKPLVVISGHQCGQVTERVTACDHMAAQIPPYTTWGYTFLLNPLGGRRSGDLYRFATLQDNTDVTITCVDAGSSTSTVEHTTTLNTAQNPNWGQFETNSEVCTGNFAPKYCCLESSNPVVLAQYSYGYTRDASCNGGEFGDPFMSVIPPIVQYLRLYHLVPVNISSGPIVNHFFSVSVPARYFQTDRIMLDNAPLELNATQWQAIYCSTGEICGYGITKDFDNQYHSLFHADANTAIFVHTYGFSIQNSYAIAGGMELQPISGTIISCTVPDDCVVEGSSVTVTCTRSLDLTQQSRIRVSTEDGSAVAPADYTALNIPENRPSFFAGNVLNYRGGTRQDSVISFDIQTTADSDDTEPQETFFLNVSPVRTAIVLTPRVPITICGVTQDIRCPDLTDPANGMVMVAGTSPGDAAITPAMTAIS
ncbi:hypothetical protein GBAR_LOCUS28286 [Geodia barretti]|uniref:IgGFc-binding protein N-terminal domain-containing protein n=1 Tax=Geodia barretti TaxID=519541 RepID=A0AA35XGP7_GEOBA|nr:hypothetical protein GBAR_LOCUS28286 [Geodia barretti]